MSEEENKQKIREIYKKHGMELTDDEFEVEYQKVARFSEAIFKMAMKEVI